VLYLFHPNRRSEPRRLSHLARDFFAGGLNRFLVLLIRRLLNVIIRFHVQRLA